MPSEALTRYRELEAALVRERWQTSGRSSPAIEELLGAMEEAWWNLDEDEQRRLDEEPPRSLLPSELRASSTMLITALPPTPAGLLSAALRHQREAAELIRQIPPSAPLQQRSHVVSFGPACARGAQVSAGDMVKLLGTELGERGVDLALALDPVAHRHAAQRPSAQISATEGATLEQALAVAQDEVDEIALDLVSSGDLGTEDPEW
jgi:hypothetical protein